MRIISWNVNGLRSVYRNGFASWFKLQNADIVCLQEIKIDEILLFERVVVPPGYYQYANSALKKGYSGVLIYSKQKPAFVETKIGNSKFDSEGRFLELKFGGFVLTNVYIPHGGREKENLQYKLEVYEKLLRRFSSDSRNRIILGDFNVAHTEIDLERPKQNQDNIMFTAKERLMLDRMERLGFVDTFRLFCKDRGHYTWWPYMRNAWDRNLGWRIDYCFVSENLIEGVNDAFILSGTKGSDHCPLGIDINTRKRTRLSGNLFV